jgi:hypothetical protein
VRLPDIGIVNDDCPRSPGFFDKADQRLPHQGAKVRKMIRKAQCHLK